MEEVFRCDSCGSDYDFPPKTCPDCGEEEYFIHLLVCEECGEEYSYNTIFNAEISFCECGKQIQKGT